jgi:FkbM family methyltransferase
MIDFNKLLFRDRTSDENVFNNVFKKNEYNLKELPEESVVIDIGAHIGSFSLKAFEMGSRNIFAFEANTHNSLICKYNCEPYNIKVFNKAIRGNKKMAFVSSRFNRKDLPEIINYGGLSIALGNDIEVITLEEVLSSVGGKIDVLKLDCEGSEYPIIFESNKNVFNNIKSIIGEIHPGSLPINFCEGFINSASNFEQYLQEQGYETNFKVNPENGFGHFFCFK